MADRVLFGMPTSPGVGVGPVVHPSARVHGVVVTADLSPADLVSFDPEVVKAVATAAGAPLSHAAILVRSRGIPTVTGLGPEVLDVAAGTLVLVDGEAGSVRVDPTAAEVEQAQARLDAARRQHDEARRHAATPVVTRDGHAIAVLANVGRPEDAETAVSEGADGVGMLRTEFAFLDRPEPPTEQDQYDAYRRVADALGERPLVIRTLDLGGDVSGWGTAAEPNPALGQRGIRFTLAARDLFDTQLRAVLRLAHERPLQVMFPMVTTVDELRAARACLDDVAQGLSGRGKAHTVDVGITVEVPAAALTADTFAPLVGFFAVGTNDLTQYTLAADRTNAAVAAITDGLHPAVLRLIWEVTAAGTRQQRPVEVVGELGTEPVAIPVLLGLGVTSLSVRPNAIAAVKQVIRAVSLDEARVLAEAAVRAESATAVRQLVAQQ